MLETSVVTVMGRFRAAWSWEEGRSRTLSGDKISAVIMVGDKTFDWF